MCQSWNNLTNFGKEINGMKCNEIFKHCFTHYYLLRALAKIAPTIVRKEK